MLPLILSTLVVGITTGFTVSKVGYYTPFMYFATIILSIATGLLTTLKPNSSTARWIGFQILYGTGFGLAIQQPLLAVQVVLKPEDAPLGMSAIIFAHTFGQTVFISVAENVFLNFFRDELSRQVPSIDPNIILNAGATSLIGLVPAGDLAAVVQVYNYAITRIFFVAVGLCCFSIVGAAIMEWKSVKKDKSTHTVDEERQAEPGAKK
jgi:hypothetical protein